MPTTLNFSYLSNFDSSELPTTLNPSATVKNRASKAGYRWVVGDDREQILTYTGSVQRAKLVSRGATSASAGSYYNPVQSSASDPYTGNSWQLYQPASYGRITWNRAYAKFKDLALDDSASLGATIAEGREAFGMIADRAIKLRRSYKHLRRGRFKDFLKEMSLKPKRKHRSVVRTAAHEASGLWLEYWFGWAPLLGDIFTSVDALQRPLPPSRKVHAVSKTVLPRKRDYVTGGSATMREVFEEGSYLVKTGARFKVTNWNLHLAAQLGLANPVSVAWELVPFSFVVDWFFKCGDVLDGLTDFAGVELHHAYTTELLKIKGTYRTGRDIQPSSQFRYSYSRIKMRRKKGIASPVILRPANFQWGQSKTRAATAVSLLTLLFTAE